MVKLSFHIALIPTGMGGHDDAPVVDLITGRVMVSLMTFRVPTSFVRTPPRMTEKEHCEG